MRSKWLEWEPEQKIMEKTDGQAPTKPSEPSFAGFEGSIPGQIPIIRLPEDSTPQTEPSHVGDLSGVPAMPAGVRLVSWEPKDPPVAIVHMGVVTDVPKFAAATLRELEARLQGKDSLAGNWSLRELAERLEQVGVKVEVVTEQAVR